MRNKKLWIAASLILVLGLVATGVLLLNTTPTPQKAKATRSVPTPAPIVAQKQETPKRTGVPVEPITEFHPGTVYSGTLGEVTGIQAGRDINKAAYEYKQYQVKLKELDDKLAEKPVVVPSLSLPPVQRTPVSEALTGETKPARLVVLSVKGTTAALTATLRSSAGTYTVRVGDTVPGFGTVSSISRDKVVVNNSPLPWL